ncbi:MAG: hypothetical protein WC792_02890 [Candidatus Micrarchaeia archaeon]|jgi:ribosomal protein S17E
MGKIKERHLKVAAEKIMVSKRANTFSEKFEHNKTRLNELGIVKGGKTDRNRLAGQVARLKKRELKRTQREQQAKAQSAPQQQPQMQSAA